MILLRVLSKKEHQLLDIAKRLLELNLVKDINLKTTVDRLELENGDLKRNKIFMMTAKTKSRLFSDIDAEIQEVCGLDVPEFYSVPITHMDWIHLNDLENRKQAV